MAEESPKHRVPLIWSRLPIRYRRELWQVQGAAVGESIAAALCGPRIDTPGPSKGHTSGITNGQCPGSDRQHSSVGAQAHATTGLAAVAGRAPS